MPFAHALAVKAAILAAIIGTGLAAVLVPTNAHATRSATPRPVALADARYAPHTLRYVLPGHGVTLAQQCGHGYYTESSAYRWDGSALGAQRWNGAHDRTYWRTGTGRRVTFDGVRVFNGTRAPILFAGWCA